MVGFHGPDINQDITSLIRDYGIGGVVLFKRNVKSAAQLQNLCQGLQQIAKDAGHVRPLFIGIDQENGLVTRISPPVASQQPGPMTLGAAGSLDYVAQVADATAEMLQYFGINMNYAPCADINSEPLNPVIGVRSSSDDAEIVAKYALACAKGMRKHQVVPCAKHFPGHGDTAVDSHWGLPVIDKSREELDKCELVPFKRAAEDGIEMVMTAHISLPQLGSDRPATISKEVLSILRDEFRYKGVIITDCMEMEGITVKYGKVDGSLLAFKAGVDSVMICHTYSVQTATIDRICEAINSGELPNEQMETSLQRLASIKDKGINWDTALKTDNAEILASINSRGAALAKKVYADAATLVRSDKDTIPLSKTAKTLFVSPGKNKIIGGGAVTGEGEPTRVPWVTDDFAERLKAFNPDLEQIKFTEEPLTADEWKRIEEAEIVMLATRNAKEAPYQRTLGKEIASRRGQKTTIAVATCAPYDFLEDTEIRTYLAVYEPTVEAFSAAVDILYGADTARGKLPVRH